MLRKSEPSLSREQAFAKVYTDPSNRELVAADKAERVAQYSETEHVAEVVKREAQRGAA